MAAERAVGERRRPPPFCVCGGRLRASLPAAEAGERPGIGVCGGGSSAAPSRERGAARPGVPSPAAERGFPHRPSDGPKSHQLFGDGLIGERWETSSARRAHCAADSPPFLTKCRLSRDTRIARISPGAVQQRFQGTALSLHRRVEEEWPQPQVGCFRPLFFCVIAIISTSPRDRSAVLSSTSGNPCERGNCESPLALCAPCFQVSCGRAGVGGAVPQPAERRRASSFPWAPQPSSNRQVPCAVVQPVRVLPCRWRSRLTGAAGIKASWLKQPRKDQSGGSERRDVLQRLGRRCCFALQGGTCPRLVKTALPPPPQEGLIAAL
ncbi:uncharacterized protein FN964_014124 isoform 1-T1 [Alca torda]